MSGTINTPRVNRLSLASAVTGPLAPDDDLRLDPIHRNAVNTHSEMNHAAARETMSRKFESESESDFRFQISDI